MKTLIVCLLVTLAIVSAVSASAELDSTALFEQFVADHGKTYRTAKAKRHAFENFKANLQRIDELNAAGNGAVFGITKFADMSQEEFVQKLLMPARPPVKHAPERYAPLPDKATLSALPDAFDWRSIQGGGAVRPVEDQGDIGSCWAFSTKENVEGQLFLTHNVSLTLSAEQLVECDYNNCGPFGGWPYLSYQYIMSNNGLISDALLGYCSGLNFGAPGFCYPCLASPWNYTMCGSQPSYNGSCNATRHSCDLVTPQNVQVSLSNWVAIQNDESVIQAQLMSLGPLSVLLNAQELSLYRSGIYDPTLCNPAALDHAVLLVGWGVQNNKPYWIVKNSWGPKWGLDGYFYIARGKDKCGIATAVTTSVVSK